MRLRRALPLLLSLALVLSASLVPSPLAPKTRAANSASRLGMVADIGTRHACDGQQGGAVDTLAATGTTWIKEEFRWDWVEPSPNNFTWECMDRAINDEQARGMEILGLLDFTAGWAVGEGRPVSPTPPPLDLWCTYVAQVVGRYHDRVHAWEVWNEPNMPHFWAGTPQQYAALLAATYDTIKAIDPGARVLAPSVSGTGEAEPWLAALPRDKYDAIALHIYTNPAFLNDQGYSYYDQGLPNLRALSQGYGKPIWITEYGFSSSDGPMPWYVGDEGLQARYLVQQSVATLAMPDLGLERMLAYVFNDHDGFEVVRGWSGPKAAFAAQQTLFAQLDGAAPQGRFNAGPGVMAFRFARGNQQIDVLWAPHGGTATIPSGSDGEIIGLTGGRQNIARTGATLTVAVGPDPVYLAHAPAGAVPGGQQCFNETGKCLREPFLNYWLSHGGLTLNGFPISDEFMETLEDGQSHRVQYFERTRLEEHPANPPGYTILLGQFGRVIHPADPAAAPLPGANYFAETGHNVGGAFLAYWQINGGLAQFGLPLTEEFSEQLADGNSYTVQYFERARFEYHPNNPDAYKVLLGQFGRQIFESRLR